MIYNSAPRGRRAVAAPGAARRAAGTGTPDRTTTPGTTPSKAAHTWVQLVTMRGHHVWLPRRYRLSAIMYYTRGRRAPLCALKFKLVERRDPRITMGSGGGIERNADRG